MRRLRPESPSTRAILALAAGLAFVLVTYTWLALADLRRDALEQARAEITGLSRILSEQTSRTFDGVALSLRSIGERLSDELGSQLALDSFLVHALLQARTVGLPQIKSTFVVDARGWVVNSSRQDFGQPFSVADRALFRHFADGSRDELFVSGPERARVDGEWTFYVSTRISDVAGNFRGVVGVAIQIPYFESLYEGIAASFITSQIQLLDLDGRLMSGNAHDDAVFGNAVGDAATIHQIAPQASAAVVIDPQAVVASQPLVAYQKVTGYPLIIRTAIGEREVLAEWRRAASLIVPGVGLILLFLSIATWLTIRYLARSAAHDASLKESDAQLRHMVHSVKDAFVTIDAEMRIVLLNDAARTLFDVRQGEVGGRCISELVMQMAPEAAATSLLRQLEDGMTLPNGVARLGAVDFVRNGQSLPVELSLSTSTYRGGLLLTVLFRDLSERKRAETQLLETNRQLRELSNSLQLIREEERTRISRELHDELGQLLTGIRMEVSWIGSHLAPAQEVLLAKIGTVKEQINQTIASIRRISSDLRPLVLDDLGFAAAAGWYVDQYAARSGIQATLSVPDDDAVVDGPAATALFRVMQEALTNVARHAAASRVDVDLRNEGGDRVLTIRDDGVGFRPPPGGKGGLGLIGMRERIEALGGSFSVRAAGQRGTVVEARIPLSETREPMGQGEQVA
ncbi:MAG TPA: histidine kinase [Azospira sp.]|nr:histidine kinase [Azospira sp.]